MTQGGPKSEKDRSQNRLVVSLAGVLGQVGCLTLLLVVAALGTGLWLDNRLNTRPTITILLVLASFPLTMYLIFRIVLRGTARLQEDPQTETAMAEGEEAERGENP